MTSRDKSNQSEKFIDAARKAGADEDPEAFKERLKQFVKAPPPKSVQKRASDHDSDCSTNNGPALPAGPCDCSAKSRK